jgi:hypothetical protein
MVESGSVGYYAMDDYRMAYASPKQGELLGASARNIYDLHMFVICLCVQPVCGPWCYHPSLHIWRSYDGHNFGIVND